MEGVWGGGGFNKRVETLKTNFIVVQSIPVIPETWREEN